jgi:hypothetical protein
LAQAAARAVRQPDQRRVDESGALARTELVGANITGWWVYVAGPEAGAFVAVVIITALRGLPGKPEREAAEGGEGRGWARTMPADLR